MAEIIMCRHGYTPANLDVDNKGVSIRDAIYYDELCPLDKQYGLRQADELGLFLAERYSDKNVLVCFGPHYRTRETASHIIKLLNVNNNVDVRCVSAIREINQGLNYARFKNYFSEDDWVAQSFYDKIKGPHRIGISYMQGESEGEVRQRTRHFAKQLKEYEQTGRFDDHDYDAIVVVSHSTTIKAIYYDMYRKNLGLKTSTASAIKVGEESELIFKPQTSVPVDYGFIDFSQYNDYFRLRSIYEDLIKLKSDARFHKFFGGHILMPLVEETTTEEGFGYSLTSLPNNSDKRGLYLIDSAWGKDNYSYDKKSKTTFYVLSGEGEFDLDGVVFQVKEGDVIEVPCNTTYYFKGKMHLVQKSEPNINNENIVVTENVEYPNRAEFNYVDGLIGLEESTIN